MSGLLQERLRPLARRHRRQSISATNIGRDRVDSRTPDIVVVHPDTARTSKAFDATAELVVEVISAGEDLDTKLDFFAEWNVNEYLTVDYRTHEHTLGARAPVDGSEWIAVTRSDVLDMEMDELFADFDWPRLP